MKKLLLSAGFALATIACSASTLDYTYNFNGGATEGYGYGKTETYDVAIRLQNPSFTGAKVTGIRVPLTVDGTEDCSAWLTSEFETQKEKRQERQRPRHSHGIRRSKQRLAGHPFRHAIHHPRRRCVRGLFFQRKNGKRAERLARNGCRGHERRRPIYPLHAHETALGPNERRTGQGVGHDSNARRHFPGTFRHILCRRNQGGCGRTDYRYPPACKLRNI